MYQFCKAEMDFNPERWLRDGNRHRHTDWLIPPAPNAAPAVGGGSRTGSVDAFLNTTSEH